MVQLQLVESPADAEAIDRPIPQDRAGSKPADALQLSVTHDLAALANLWSRLETTADLTAFQSYAWLSTWQEHVGKAYGVTPVIVTIGPRDAPLCVLPLAVRRRGILRELSILADNLSDYNAPILAPGFTKLVGADFPALWRRIETLLQNDPQSRHDFVRFEKMPAKVGEQDNPLLTLGAELHPSGAYATELVGDWDSYYKTKRNGKAQRHDRTKRKHLAAAGGTALLAALTSAETDAMVGTLIAQKESALVAMGTTNLFARPGHREFYHALAQTKSTTLRPHVSHFKVGDVAAAATNFSLRFRERYYYILASYDAGPVAKYGPGAIQLQELMAYAIGDGIKVFDFTIGDERYKREWCEIEIALYDHVSAASVTGRFVVSTLEAARRIKRSVKQSDRWWPLVLRVRSRFGALRSKFR